MVRLLPLVLLAAAPLAGCAPSPISTVEAFRAELEAGDLDAARRRLSDDPRVWYDERTGAGNPWTLGAGRWKAWDDHFRSESDLGPWRVEGRTVWAVVEEMNDYFRLIERQDTPRYRLTYFLDGAGRLEGYLISRVDPGAPAPSVSRFDEVEAWAKAHHADEWAYLRPGDRIDPTGDRAVRTRALINRWRIESGLAPIE